MGFEWQFGTESRAGEETRANRIGCVEIVDDDASACTSAHGVLRESVSVTPLNGFIRVVGYMSPSGNLTSSPD